MTRLRMGHIAMGNLGIRPGGTDRGFSGRAVILANGDIGNPDLVRTWIRDGDLVIAADGGAHHALAAGLVPDIVLGDFDSLSSDDLSEIERAGARVVRVPAEKDETDTHLAIKMAIESCVSEVILLGATGDRLDHTLSNLLLLPPLVEAGITVRVIDSKNDIRLVAGGSVTEVSGTTGRFVSLIPLTPEVTGINLSGFKYPLLSGRLAWGLSLGVSNELTGESGQVEVGEGMLAVIIARD